MNNNNNNDLSNSNPINNNIKQIDINKYSDKLQNNPNLPSDPTQNKKDINIQKNNYEAINKNSLNLNINNEELKQIQNNISEENIIDNQNKESFAFEKDDEIQNPILKLLNENNNIKDSYLQMSIPNIQEQLVNGINNNNIQNSIIINNNNHSNNNDKSNNVNKNEPLFDNKISKTCFKNLGESFYLDAVLHCLTNIDDLKKYFLDENNAKYMIDNIKKLPLSFVTSRLFKHFYVKKDKLYPLESYLRVLGSKNKIFETKNSRNANDCLTFILNTLDNELNKPNNKNEKLKYKQTEREEVIKCEIENLKNEYNSIIYNVFNWFQLKELHCTECGELIYKFNTYNTFQLDNLEFYKKFNRNKINLFECIKYETNKSTILFCYACKKQANINIISSIYKAPKVFVFLLNDGNFNAKYSDFNFVLEEKINLKKLIDAQNSPVKYQLNGIVSIDVNNKKYVSFCKLNDGKWYLFNEEAFSEIQLNQIILENDNSKFFPCILFYKSMD